MKRAANRKSASTSRARKKAYVDDMTAKNERMKQHALILSMLPDLVLAVCRSGEMTYVSPASQWLLLHAPEEVTGANIFELVTHDCHPLLRKMISENLSRPVHAQTAGRDSNETEGSQDEADRSDDDSRSRGCPPAREHMGNHRERLQQRYRQSQASRSNGSFGKDGRRGGDGRVTTSASQRPNMLRLIRRNKTTVWCESRLSVRTAKSENAASFMPLEIILTLRTVSEGSKTSVAHGLAGARVPAFDCPTLARPDDADEYMEADDDGYQCEAEEDSNSGSGNDSGTMRNGDDAANGGGTGGGAKKRGMADQETMAASIAIDGRNERSMSKKRQRVSNGGRMEDIISAAVDADRKSRSEESSTAGDTGGSTNGSTTQEGSGSGSNEADSNGEGSNNGSKWGDEGGGEMLSTNRSRYEDCIGSEDSGSSDGSSASGTDLGDEVQSAVQSLILMGGSFSEGAS